MSFELSDHLWMPQRRGLIETIAKLEAGKSVVLYAPTGGGKTTQAVELFRWCAHHHMKGNFYVNRKLLVGQTSERFASAGIHHGVRAADYEDLYDYDAPFQISSAPTEQSRVVKQGKWEFAESDLIIVDEGHLQKTSTMENILRYYRERGAKIVILTATPVEMSDWADEIVISGKLQEYRDCGALVPAIFKSISAPDLSKVKRNLTGEFILDGRKRQIFTQSIVGDVIGKWKEYNPDARPTILTAPDVAGSIWFTEQFEKIGVNWCHVDATDAVVDGKQVKLTRSLWVEIQERFKAGDIKGLSARMKLREGLDIPCTYHSILATPIGSLASYLQTVGRVLRSAPGKDHAIVSDHGGCYLNLGSPNHDRPWDLLWRLPERAASKLHRGEIKEGKKSESIVCPVCSTERSFGDKCPSCGHMHSKSSRKVIMEDGTMKTVEGTLIPLIKRITKKHTEDDWARMFWGFRKKKCEKTFAQMEAYFFHVHKYWPKRDIPFMPVYDSSWYMPVHEVPLEHIRGTKKRLETTGVDHGE